MATIVGLVFAVIAIWIHIAADKEHRAKYGVGLPSKNARKRYRRRARERGLSEADAHFQWVQNKHRWQGTPLPAVKLAQSQQLSAGPSAFPAIDLDRLEKAITSPQPASPKTSFGGIGLAAFILILVGGIAVKALWTPEQTDRPVNPAPTPSAALSSLPPIASFPAETGVPNVATSTGTTTHVPVLHVLPPRRPNFSSELKNKR